MRLTRLALAVGLLFTAASAPAGTDDAKARRPYGGKPMQIPGWIDAEKFDDGPAGVAYHNIEPIFEPDAKQGPRAVGLAYRKTPVELEEGRGGIMMIAAIKEGEWLTYTVDVQQEGAYDIEAVLAGWRDGDKAGAIRVEFDGVDKTGLIPVPNTKKWYLFKTVQKPNVVLKKGVQTMRIVAAKGSMVMNIDGLRFNPGPNTALPPPPPKPAK